MTSRERVLSALARKGFDRIPVKHEGTPEVNQVLMEHFGLSNHEQLLRMVGDDFRYVQPAYAGPELRTFSDGSIEGFWGERYAYKEYPGGKYLEPVHLPYAGIDRPEQLEAAHFPTADWFDFSQLKAQCAAAHPEFAVCFGSAGDMDFINTIGRMRGMQEVLEDMATENPAFMRILDARFEFYYGLHKRALETGDGLIDIVHVGEDLGTQRGQTISLEMFDRLLAPRYEALFDLAHKQGAKTMMHMCGCVVGFLPRLIEIGLDIQDVVQPATPEMDIAHLKEHFGDRLAFCGSMCVQSVLPFGTTADVEGEVRRRLELFPDGGLLLGPTHAIQVGTPIENILAMYRTAGSLRDCVDDYVLAAASEGDDKGVDLFKLF